MKLVITALVVIGGWFLIWYAATLLHPFADKHGTGIGLDFISIFSGVVILICAMALAVIDQIKEDEK